MFKNKESDKNTCETEGISNTIQHRSVEGINAKRVWFLKLVRAHKENKISDSHVYST